MLNIYETTVKWANINKLTVHAEKYLESTNSYAKKNIDNCNFVITEFQSKGRGRGDNIWISPKAGDGLLCSFVLKLNSSPQPISTALIGIMLYKSFKSTFKTLKWSLKAPNDIWLGNKKISGILCETIQTGDIHNIIIGLGINFLSAPNLETSTHIPRELVTQESTVLFLDTFNQYLQNSIREFVTPNLSKAAKEELISALNACPYYLEKIKSISDNCDIIFDHKTLNWYSL